MIARCLSCQQEYCLGLRQCAAGEIPEGTINEPHRVVTDLYREGLNRREMAERLGKSPDSIRSYIARAVRTGLMTREQAAETCVGFYERGEECAVQTDGASADRGQISAEE